MKLINIIYEDDLTDVDMILVPDWMEEKISQYAQNFVDWLVIDPEQTYKIANSEMVVYVCETEGFVDWLNKYVINNESEKAIIVSQHCKYNDEYLSVEF